MIGISLMSMSNKYYLFKEGENLKMVLFLFVGAVKGKLPLEIFLALKNYFHDKLKGSKDLYILFYNIRSSKTV